VIEWLLLMPAELFFSYFMALVPLCCMLNREAANTSLLVIGLNRPVLESRSTTLERSMLTLNISDVL